MEQDYRVETLINTFEEHAIISEQNRLFSIDNFKQNFPNEPLPEHFNNTFNISKALSCICMQIDSLKKEVSRLQNVTE